MRTNSFVFTLVVLGAIAALTVNASFETDLTCRFTQTERSVVVMESPQPDGVTKKVVSEIYLDRVFRGTVSNEVIYATNTIDTGTAVIKTIPVDDRRVH